MITLKDIKEDKSARKSGQKFYAVTDKGFICGSTPKIVMNKVTRLGAKEKTYISNEEHRKLYLESLSPEERERIENDQDELPF